MFLRILYATIAILAIIAAYKAVDIYTTRLSAVDVSPEQIIGPEEADLDVVIFLDYQCPYCKDIYPTIKQAVEEDGNSRLIIQLIPAMGEESARIARLAYAAELQGKFNEVHNILLGHYGPFDNSDLKRVAGQLGMDLEKWLEDSESEDIKERLEDNVELAGKVGVYAAPTFLIGKIIYTPVENLPEVSDFQKLFAEAREN